MNTATEKKPATVELYLLDQYYREAFSESVNMETGEITNASLFDFLTEIDESKKAKVLNICVMIKNLKAEIEMISNEKRTLDLRKKTCENKIESLKKYIANNIDNKEFDKKGNEINKGDKFKNARAQLYWSSSSPLIYDKEKYKAGNEAVNNLPEKYKKSEIRVEAIKKDIQNDKISIQDMDLYDDFSIVKKGHLVIR